MTNLSITGECTTSMEQFGKGFCLSIVHSGVNKMLSNNAIIENYTGYVIMTMALCSH